MTDPMTAFPSWLELARRGDAPGFAAIYDWLGPEIKRFAVARSARDADAVTNDAFVAAFRRLGDFEGDAAAFRSWVYAIVRNGLIDAHRFEQRRPPVAEGGTDDGDRAVADGPEELVVAGLDTGVADLLAGLTDAQREVLVLRVVNGLSLEETADAVRRPVTAVKRLQARALTQLRRRISEEGVS